MDEGLPVGTLVLGHNIVSWAGIVILCNSPDYSGSTIVDRYGVMVIYRSGSITFGHHWTIDFEFIKQGRKEGRIVEPNGEG
jgi:hypothetical protein